MIRDSRFCAAKFRSLKQDESIADEAEPLEADEGPCSQLPDENVKQGPSESVESMPPSHGAADATDCIGTTENSSSELRHCY